MFVIALELPFGSDMYGTSYMDGMYVLAVDT